MKKKYQLAGVICGVLLLTLGLVGTARAAGEIRVMVDNQLVYFGDQQPFINSANRTMVPVRAPMEAMQATVMWDDKTKTATINKNNRNAVFTVGSSIYYVQGQKQVMDTEAVIRDGRTAFPIKYAAESMGATVIWNGTTRTVMIYTSLSPKVNVIGSAEIDRLRSYKYSESVKAPLGTFASQEPALADYLLKEGVAAIKLQPQQRFIASKEVLWASSTSYHVRGVLQTNNNNGSFLEQDMDYGLIISNAAGSMSIDPIINSLNLGEARLTK